MLFQTIFLALVLPFAGIGFMLTVYACLMWCAASRNGDEEIPAPVKEDTEVGLSREVLEKLPRIPGKELVQGTDCAVCLDDIGEEQPATLVPGCNHGFHMECAQAWLSKTPVCPVCRYKVDPEELTA